ncbi:MAG: metallophosphoesterase [Deltaproteobacteria bacterium]|nr:metallophosphoesterase [Deltaproteobacteria bacterium]
MFLFLLSFFLIYGGMHVYAYCKAKSALQFTPGVAVTLAAFMTLMTPAPILVHFLKSWGFEFAARLLAYGGYTWMGFLFLFFSSSLAMDCYNVLVRLLGVLPRVDTSRFVVTGKKPFFVLLLLVVSIGCYGLFDARHIRTEKIKIVTSKLPPGLDRITIAQVSDIHLGLTVRHSFLEKVIAIVNTANPDLLVSTGDLVDAQINHLTGLAELFQQVKPRYGKFAITGNHEFYAGIKQAIAFTERAGFKVLRGEGITVKGLFNIVGVDDPAGIGRGQVNPKEETEVLGSVSQNLFTLFLKHRPEVHEDTVGLFDLQLSGHTHRGQIFPFSIITKLAYPMQNGLHRLTGGAVLYTNRGTGTWGPPMRFLAPPEVTIIEVVSDREID